MLLNEPWGFSCFCQPMSWSAPCYEGKIGQLAALEHPVPLSPTAGTGELSVIVLPDARPLMRSLCFRGQNICQQSDGFCLSR